MLDIGLPLYVWYRACVFLCADLVCSYLHGFYTAALASCVWVWVRTKIFFILDLVALRGTRIDMYEQSAWWPNKNLPLLLYGVGDDSCSIIGEGTSVLMMAEQTPPVQISDSADKRTADSVAFSSQDDRGGAAVDVGSAGLLGDHRGSVASGAVDEGIRGLPVPLRVCWRSLASSLGNPLQAAGQVRAGAAGWTGA